MGSSRKKIDIGDLLRIPLPFFGAINLKDIRGLFILYRALQQNFD